MDNTTQLQTNNQPMTVDPQAASPVQPLVNDQPGMDQTAVSTTTPVIAPVAAPAATSTTQVLDEMALDLDGYDGDDEEEELDQVGKTKNDALLEEAQMVDILLEERKRATKELEAELARIKTKYGDPTEDETATVGESPAQPVQPPTV